MINVLLCVSYDGTQFHGYQSQSDARNVQDSLECAISEIYNTSISSYAAGRTDSGVHAERQYVNFKIPQSHIPIDKLSYVLNSLLPNDIRILWSKLVDENFHARFSALRRSYYYQIYEGNVLAPFRRAYFYGVPLGLDWELIKNEFQELVGTNDFRAFTKSQEKTQNYIRTLYSIKLEEMYNMRRVYFEANGFLWKMVRSIVGTVLERAIDRKRGKTIDRSITQILQSKDRSLSGTTAPAWALYLHDVYYN